MRIIAGEWGGRRITIPNNSWPTRPTTDRTREALFNRWHHEYDWSYTTALDLFAGTGLISLEFLSRGVPEVHSVEQHPAIIQHLKETRDQFLAADRWTLHPLKVEDFLRRNSRSFGLIFADPPYDWSELPHLPDLIFNGPGLLDQGQLVIEHDRRVDFRSHNRCFEQRSYGQSRLSFFE